MSSPGLTNLPHSGIRAIFLQRSGALRSGWRLALFYVLSIACAAALFVLLDAAGLGAHRGEAGAAPERFLRLLRVAGIVGVVVLVSAALLWATERRTLATLGLPLRARAIPGALLGILAGAAPVALSVAIFAGVGVATVRLSDAPAAALAPAGLSALAVTSLGSALEEFLYRGYPLQLLIEGAGRGIAALLTSLVWALTHSDNPGANAIGVLELALSGCMLAWVVIRTGSLWFAIGYHVAWNVGAAHFFGLTTSGYDLGASVLRTTLSGPAWLTGGAYGFEGSLVTGILDILGLATALLVSRHVPRVAEVMPYFERRLPPATLSEGLTARQ